MRKALAFISLCLAVALSVTGCDFFRTLAGRPTSREIEAKRAIISHQESATQKVDEAAVPADTVQVVTEPVEEAAPVKEKTVEKKPSADGRKRYYVVIASFSNPDNAKKSLARMADKGYQGEILGLKGGFYGVGLCGTDDEQEAKESLKELKRQDFCPAGIWIIDRNKR